MRIVTIAPDVVPTFPDFCPVCDLEHPSGTLTVSGLQWDQKAPPHYRRLGLFFSTKMPGCAACGWRLRGSVYGRRLGLVAMMVASMVFAHYLYGGVPPKYFLVLVLAPFLLFVLYWEISNPKAISLELSGVAGGVQFVFLNDAYAEDFAELNGVEALPRNDPDAIDPNLM